MKKESLFGQKNMPCKVCGGYGHNKATCPQLNPGAKRAPSYSAGSFYHRRQQNFTVRVAQPSSAPIMSTIQSSTSSSRLPIATSNLAASCILPASSSVDMRKDDEEYARRREEDRLRELENAERFKRESKMLQEQYLLQQQERRKQEAMLEVQRKEAERVRAKRSRSQEWAETSLQSEAQRCAVYYLDWNDTIRPLKKNEHTQSYYDNDCEGVKQVRATMTKDPPDCEWIQIRKEVDRIQCCRDMIKERIEFLTSEYNRAKRRGRRLLVCSIPARIQQYEDQAKLVEDEMKIWGGKQLIWLKQHWLERAETCA